MGVTEEARTVAALREVLARVGYVEEGVRELARPDGIDLPRGLAALRLRPAAEDPLCLLVRLFLAGEELDADGVAAAVAPLALADLEALGLVRLTDTRVMPGVRLTPVRGVVVASDPEPSGRIPADHVIYPSPSSELLAKLTIRQPVARALDLCTGSGVQALLAAGHCERGIGTDINPRALQLAALSAALNGIENVEWRCGDLFEPVGADKFDLVVANPPFVISPARALIFRDSGHRHDELSRRVVVGCAALLTDGGFAHVLCSWVRADGEHWSRTPRNWLAASGCDAIILQVDSVTPASYAIGWTSMDSVTPSEAAERARPWTDYYREQGITEITTGLITLRRRAASNWMSSEEPTAIRWGADAQLLRMFAGHDALETLQDAPELLDRRLSLAPDVSLVERWQPADRLARARLTIGAGISVPGRITPPAAAACLHQLDGRRTLQEAAAGAHITHTTLVAALPSLSDLVKRGYLVVN